MIDRAGLKGLQIGGAIVSEKHANFFIAQKGCTSQDVLRLIDIAKEKVLKQFNVELELEIEIWK
jgi:UDP-N-acetylmuramate dehydrogenase